MTAPDKSRPGTTQPFLRRALLAVGWVSLAAGLSAVSVNLFPELQRRLVVAAILASFTPYLIAAWLAGGSIFLIAAHGGLRAVAAFCALGLALQVHWTSPYWPREPATRSATWTFMTINLRCMHADLDELRAEVERVGPDVVVLVDACVHMRAALERAGLGELLPYDYWQDTRRSRPGTTFPCWTAVAARGPIRLVTTTATENPQHTLRVELPEAPLALIAVDVANLAEAPRDWATDLTAVREAVEAVDPTAPLVVLGDFNAVREHAPMVELRAEGLVDAAEQAGAGWLRTFPSDWTVPPILAIDHVLLRGGLTGASVWTFRVGGTDHLGLVARIGTATQDVAG